MLIYAISTHMLLECTHDNERIRLRKGAGGGSGSQTTQRDPVRSWVIFHQPIETFVPSSFMTDRVRTSSSKVSWKYATEHSSICNGTTRL